MKNQLHNLRRIPMKFYEFSLKMVGRFHHPWYMKHYVRYLKKRGMDIGTGAEAPIYIAVNASFDGKDLSKIHIGKGAVISGDVRVLTHDYSIARAFKSSGVEMEKEAYLLRDVYIGDNSFIGAKAILLPGSIIGNNVIIGAGSVVRGKIPDGTIAIGNPAVVSGRTEDFAKKHFAKKDYLLNK